MEIGAAVEARLETGGRGLLAMREEAHLTEGAPKNVPAGRQAILMIRVGIVVIHRASLDARGTRVHRHALDAEELLLQADLVPGVTDQLAGAADDAVGRDAETGLMWAAANPRGMQGYAAGR